MLNKGVDDMLNKRRVIAVVAVLLLIFAVTIGYAVLSASVGVIGASKISGETWDLHFTNYHQTANSTVTPASGKAPEISGNNTTSVSYEVEFAQPGDVYEFTLDVVNAGSIDAMIDDFQTKIKIDDDTEEILTSSNMPAYLEYTVTYSDGIALAANQKLAADSTKPDHLLVHVEFKKNISNEQFLAAKGKSIKFTFELNYIQANSNAVTVTHSYA